jgi:hypothetical protein
VLARRRALHFLLHHVPASPALYPHLTAVLAAQAGFWAVGRALAQGDLSILDDAHFFLPPLCSLLAPAGRAPVALPAAAGPGAGALLGQGATPSGGAGAQQGPAYTAALQLACALLAADSAALGVLLGAAPDAAAGAACEACLACMAGTAGLHRGLVQEAAAAAAASAGSWKCLPALWQVRHEFLAL